MVNACFAPRIRPMPGDPLRPLHPRVGQPPRPPHLPVRPPPQRAEREGGWGSPPYCVLVSTFPAIPAVRLPLVLAGPPPRCQLAQPAEVDLLHVRRLVHRQFPPRSAGTNRLDYTIGATN